MPLFDEESDDEYVRPKNELTIQFMKVAPKKPRDEEMSLSSPSTDEETPRNAPPSSTRERHRAVLDEDSDTDMPLPKKSNNRPAREIFLRHDGEVPTDARLVVATIENVVREYPWGKVYRMIILDEYGDMECSRLEYRMNFRVPNTAPSKFLKAGLREAETYFGFLSLAGKDKESNMARKKRVKLTLKRFRQNAGLPEKPTAEEKEDMIVEEDANGNVEVLYTRKEAEILDSFAPFLDNPWATINSLWNSEFVHGRLPVESCFFVYILLIKDGKIEGPPLGIFRREPFIARNTLRLCSRFFGPQTTPRAMYTSATMKKVIGQLPAKVTSIRQVLDAEIPKCKLWPKQQRMWSYIYQRIRWMLGDYFVPNEVLSLACMTSDPSVASLTANEASNYLNMITEYAHEAIADVRRIAAPGMARIPFDIVGAELVILSMTTKASKVRALIKNASLYGQTWFKNYEYDNMPGTFQDMFSLHEGGFTFTCMREYETAIIQVLTDAVNASQNAGLRSVSSNMADLPGGDLWTLFDAQRVLLISGPGNNNEAITQTVRMTQVKYTKYPLIVCPTIEHRRKRTSHGHPTVEMQTVFSDEWERTKAARYAPVVIIDSAHVYGLKQMFSLLTRVQQIIKATHIMFVGDRNGLPFSASIDYGAPFVDLIRSKTFRTVYNEPVDETIGQFGVNALKRFDQAVFKKDVVGAARCITNMELEWVASEGGIPLFKDLHNQGEPPVVFCSWNNVKPLSKDIAMQIRGDAEFKAYTIMHNDPLIDADTGLLTLFQASCFGSGTWRIPTQLDLVWKGAEAKIPRTHALIYSTGESLMSIDYERKFRIEKARHAFAVTPSSVSNPTFKTAMIFLDEFITATELRSVLMRTTGKVYMVGSDTTLQKICARTSYRVTGFKQHLQDVFTSTIITDDAAAPLFADYDSGSDDGLFVSDPQEEHTLPPDVIEDPLFDAWSDVDEEAPMGIDWADDQ